MTNSTAAAVALFDRKPLVDALAMLATSGGVIERRNTIPIVAAVLVEATDEGARLTGSDLDIYASVTVPAAWEARGSFAVSDPRALLAAVKACAGETVTLAHEGGVLSVTGDGMASRLETLPASDFPTPSPIDPAKASAFALPADHLAADLRRTLHTVSSEETRYYLNGVFIHTTDDADGKPVALRMAATDGHRLTRVTRDVPASTGLPIPAAIYPRKLVALVIKAIGKVPAGDVSFTVTGARVDVVAGAWSFRAKLIDGTFPDYSRVIPTCNSHRATIDAPAFAAALSKLAKAGKVNKTEACKMTFSDAGGALRVGTAAAPIAVAWDDKRADKSHAFVIGGNVDYLAGIAGLFPDGDIILTVEDAAAPFVITSAAAPEFLAVLMPLRIDGGTMPAKASERARIEPIVSALDAFETAYAAAYLASDGVGMKAAIAAYRATADYRRNADGREARAHDQMALICGNARVRALRSGSQDADSVRRTVKARAQVRRSSQRDSCAYKLGTSYYAAGSFKRIGERMAVAAADAARFVADLARIGYDAATDGRDVVPVILKDGGKRSFVLAEQLANAGQDFVYFVKANGTHPRRATGGARYAIERVVPVRAVKASPAPAAAPGADGETLARLEATIAAQAAMIATLVERMGEFEARAAAPAQVEPVAAVAAETDGTDGRDAYIRTLLAERDEAREDAAAATARANDFDRIATAQTVRADKAEDAAADLRRRNDVLFYGQIAIHDRRRRTAERLIATRAVARTARREAIGMTTAHRIAAAELARLQPIADAIAAMTPVAPASTGLRLVAAA